MQAVINKETRSELIETLRDRYRQAARTDKGRILDEFAVLSGCHRKHAIRLLRKPVEGAIREAKPGRRIYNEAVKQALILVWEAADRICGKRLKALIPNLVTAMERHGHLALEAEARKGLFEISAATIDRLLKAVRTTAGSRRKRSPVKRLSREIPTKTFHDWKDPVPGYLEIDFVVHGGGSMAGEYLHSLVATDVCTGWTEAVPLLAREQSLVVEGLKRIRSQMPVPVLGIDSDNDGAFINDTVAIYCRDEKIVFTRSRAYHKNDNAWIEQKNGAVIRRMVGHARFSGMVAGQALAQLLQAVRLYVNYFQPSFKLRERKREGGKVRKIYHFPATPSDRLLAHAGVDENVKAALRVQLAQLDPVELLQRIRQGQAALAALSAGSPGDGPTRQNLDDFLAQLPEMWRQGEVRPTHKQGPPKDRSWRTREDPFAAVWTDILLWLQVDPDITAKSLLVRLNEKYPGQYPTGQLRTLQRRIGEWRQTMARKLICTGVVIQNDVSAVSGAAHSLEEESPLRFAALTSAPTPPPVSAVFAA